MRDWLLWWDEMAYQVEKSRNQRLLYSIFPINFHRIWIISTSQIFYSWEIWYYNVSIWNLCEDHNFGHPQKSNNKIEIFWLRLLVGAQLQLSQCLSATLSTCSVPERLFVIYLDFSNLYRLLFIKQLNITRQYILATWTCACTRWEYLHFCK